MSSRLPSAEQIKDVIIHKFQLTYWPLLTLLKPLEQQIAISRSQHYEFNLRCKSPLVRIRLAADGKEK